MKNEPKLHPRTLGAYNATLLLEEKNELPIQPWAKVVRHVKEQKLGDGNQSMCHCRGKSCKVSLPLH
jgi:hypothetical protein